MAVLLFAGQISNAQTGTSSISGTVTDANGNVAVGATVTLSNPEKNFTRTQTTSDDGGYSFSAIPPDTYQIEVSASGFKKVVLNKVTALVAKPTEANIQLEVGNVAETVNVSAEASESLINTQDATLGNNFESRQITQLPLEARDVTSLLTLQPGTTREGYVAGCEATKATSRLTASILTRHRPIRPELRKAVRVLTHSTDFPNLLRRALSFG